MGVKDMKGRKVLIVEDERRIARFLQMELEHEGCIAAVEDNGSRACVRIARAALHPEGQYHIPPGQIGRAHV